jgi:IS5 family transposase
VDLGKGHLNAEREARLIAAGWRFHIQRKAPKRKPLSACQKGRNTRIRGEHVFASHRQMGGQALRCMGLARATLHL